MLLRSLVDFYKQVEEWREEMCQDQNHIDDLYRILNPIGSGSFGEVCLFCVSVY